MSFDDPNACGSFSRECAMWFMNLQIFFFLQCMQRRVSTRRRETFRVGSRRDDARQDIALLDIGSIWTRVGVTGDMSLRMVSRTPRELSDRIHTTRDEDDLASVLFSWLHAIALRVPEIMCGSGSVLLVGPSPNPLFVALTQRWLAAASGSCATVLSAQLASLSSFGFSHGVLLDVGWFSSRAVAVVGGVVDYDSVVMSAVGGQLVEEQLRKDIVASNSIFSSGGFDQSLITAELLFAFLHAYGVVSPVALSSPSGMKYPLPIKTALVYGSPVDALEHLFRGDVEFITVPALVKQCLKKAQKVCSCMSHLCVVGGLAKWPNFTLRLRRELQELRSEIPEVTIYEKKLSSSAICAAVVGGLILVSLPS